jgi:nucleoside-diphosphate-sugar epimerase
MKVLLTGANGFVGSHIAECLVENGHEALCLVRKTSNTEWLKNVRVKYCYGDITDPASLVEPIKECQAIIHNAGLVRAFNKEAYLKANQLGTRNIVEAANKYNPSLQKIIYISSQAAMGPGSSMIAKKLTEAETPVSDYGESKLAGEIEVRSINNKIPYTILRSSSVYGPRDKDILMFFKLINWHICPESLKKSYFQLVFVRDLAKFTVDSLVKVKTNNNLYFIGDSKPYSHAEIGKSISKVIEKTVLHIPIPQFVFYIVSFFAGIAAKISGKPAVLNMQKVREMNQTYWLADNSKTLEDFRLGFTNFEIGAKITYSWYKENGWL